MFSKETCPYSMFSSCWSVWEYLMLSLVANLKNWVDGWLVEEQHVDHSNAIPRWKDDQQRSKKTNEPTWHFANWSKNCSFNGERRAACVLEFDDGSVVRWSSRRFCCKRSTVLKIDSNWVLGPTEKKEFRHGSNDRAKERNERWSRGIWHRWSSKRDFCIRWTRSISSSRVFPAGV